MSMYAHICCFLLFLFLSLSLSMYNYARTLGVGLLLHDLVEVQQKLGPCKCKGRRDN